MKSSQLSFVWLSSPAERPYGSAGLNSKYQGQMGPVPSRYHLNYGPGADGARGHRVRGHDANPELRAWFGASEFQGNIARFAAELGVNQRTVEEWIYGRRRPRGGSTPRSTASPAWPTMSRNPSFWMRHDHAVHATSH